MPFRHNAIRHEDVSEERLPAPGNSPVSGTRPHLVTSAWKGRTNIMTMGWHTMMQFTPALFGCYICAGNHSFEMIRRSRECVINLPTSDLVEVVVEIGNTSGAKIDKFQKFRLTAVPGDKVEPADRGVLRQLRVPAGATADGNFEVRIFHLGSRQSARRASPQSIRRRSTIGATESSWSRAARSTADGNSNRRISDSWSHGSQSEVGGTTFECDQIRSPVA